MPSENSHTQSRDSEFEPDNYEEYPSEQLVVLGLTNTNR